MSWAGTFLIVPDSLSPACHGARLCAPVSQFLEHHLAHHVRNGALYAVGSECLDAEIVRTSRKLIKHVSIQTRVLDPQALVKHGARGAVDDSETSQADQGGSIAILGRRGP